MKGLFVTGTDTGVGKTILSAASLLRYRGVAQLRYWKPVQTGIEQDDDTAAVRQLSAASDAEILDDGIRLRRPVSPHLAAKWAGTAIDLDKLPLLPSDGTAWIVEGAGGVLAPLNDTQTIVDLIAMLGMPTLIAARSGLGTINHTCLTVEALRVRSIPVTGVVLIGDPNADNAAAIEHYAQVPVIAQMPRLVPLTPESLAGWTATYFDPQGRLCEFFQ
jgi:malonyl-CoA O-methyltransferase